MTEQEKQDVLRELLSNLGKKGGATTRDRNPNQYKEMNKKSLESRRRNSLKRLQEACKEEDKDVK